MKRWLLRIGVYFTLVIGLVCTLLMGAWWELERSLEHPIELGGAAARFDIRPGESARAIARRMHEMGWIAHPLMARFESRRQGIDSAFRAGLYEIPNHATPRQILELFASGRVKRFAVTLIEGSTFEQILATLAAAPDLLRTVTATGPDEVVDALEIGHENPEGLFFPDTYHYVGGDRDIDILRRSHQRLQQVLAAEWAERAEDTPYATPYEALIMASIVEKETGQAGERGPIAGVFVRRLQKGMKLQTDPTVIYGLGDRFDGNLRRVDLETDTSYNTYTRIGLPPTPIAAAGRAAIHAALHPSPGNALYFVARGDGSHQFSSSLREHNAAVRKFQLKRGER